MVDYLRFFTIKVCCYYLWVAAKKYEKQRCAEILLHRHEGIQVSVFFDRFDSFSSYFASLSAISSFCKLENDCHCTHEQTDRWTHSEFKTGQGFVQFIGTLKLASARFKGIEKNYVLIHYVTG